MRILYLCSDSSDYLADSLFHGLRLILGDDVVDFPKKESMYKTCPAAEIAQLHGHGFTLYGLLPDSSTPRVFTIQERFINTFTRIVISSIRDCFGWFVQLSQLVPPEKLVVLDGSDWPHPYPYCKYWLKHPAFWFLPRVSRRTLYFKRELTPDTNWHRFYKLMPKALSKLLRFPSNYRPIAFSIPEERIAGLPGRTSKQFPRHIVDAEVAAAVGGGVAYPFSTQDEYFADLRDSTFGITMKRAGWDCMRHYELAANGCAICFRDLDKKPATCAPHGLVIGHNCLSYTSAADLLKQIDRLTIEEVGRLRGEAICWAKENTTRRRAAQFLSECGVGMKM